jgi:hypothetical protein
MGRQFQISRLLSEEDRETFRALALNEGITTIQALHAWLTERGYKVSHGAVYNYAKHCRKGFLASMRRQFDTRSDAELRKMLATWARHLTGAELVSVAFLAAFHAEAKALREGQSKRARSSASGLEMSCD